MPFENILDRFMGQQPGTTQAVRSLNKIHQTPKSTGGLKPTPYLRGKLVGRGNLAAQGLSLLEQAVANSGTEYGNKVKTAGLQHEKGIDNALAYGNQFFEQIFRNKPEKKPTSTTLQDGSIRTGGGDVYSPDGKRYTTSGGVTYDLATGQAINPATNKISEGGYSIDPDSGKRTDSRVNANGILQTGRDFNKMAKEIFEPMEERLKKAGASEGTLASVSAMGSEAYTKPANLFSSINLPNATSQNSFEDPQIAFSTGAIQPRNVDTNFMKGGTQFESPNPDMPSVATTPGIKAPVEYTNYMASSDPALGAMDALRMNDMQNDLIYASGQYFTKGADGNALMVDRDLAKQVKAGVEGASERLAKHVAQGGFEVPNAAEMAIRRAAAANAARMNR